MRINRDNVELALGESNYCSFAALARGMGCSPQNLYVVLRRGSCRPATAGKIARALKVPLETIAEAVNE